MTDKVETVEEVSGPLVFSCINCKTIIGDSYSLFYSSEEYKTITLSASSNIQRTSELYTSYKDHDKGSSFYSFVCLNCQHPLGRYYVTTNVNVDNIREKFTFDIDSISSYELGKAQYGKSDTESPKSNEERVSAAGSDSALSEEVLKVTITSINCNVLLILCVCQSISDSTCGGGSCSEIVFCGKPASKSAAAAAASTSDATT